MKKLFVLFTSLILVQCSNDEGGLSSDMDQSGGSETGVGGSLARFTISNDHLYTVDETNLKVFDIKQPDKPIYIEDKEVGFGVETIYPKDNNLFLGTMEGMYIYDISVPESPKRLSFFSHITSCDPVVVDDNYAYITLNTLNEWCGNNENELQIVDIGNLSNPKLVKTYQMSGPRGLGIDSTTLFVCDEGLKVFDASDVNSLKLRHHFRLTAKDVIPLDSMLFVIGEAGFYQYKYKNDTIEYISKIEISIN
jgi:hypothetical protein